MREERSSSSQDDSVFEPTPVLFVPSQQSGSDIAVYPLRGNPSLVYEFNLKKRCVNHLTFVCCGCRALKDKYPEEYRQPLPIASIEGGLFLTDPEEPKNPHFCVPRDAERVIQRREALMQKYNRNDLMDPDMVDAGLQPGPSRSNNVVVHEAKPEKVIEAGPSSITDDADVPSTSQGSRNVRPNRVRLDEIDDDTYHVFCEETLGRTADISGVANREIINNMCAAEEFGVIEDFEDEDIGVLPGVVVHLPSQKYILSPSMRAACIENLIAKVKNDRNPISFAIQTINKKYIGFPPAMKLRSLLFDELDRQVPSSITSEHRRAMNAPIPIRSSAIAAVHRPNPLDAVDTSLPSTSSLSNKPTETASTSLSMLSKAIPKSNVHNDKVLKRVILPIDDEIYDLIVDVLSKKKTMDEILVPHQRMAVFDHLRNDMQCELWQYSKEMCPAGYRLLSGGKIIPRKSEIEEIWRVCHENLSHTHSPAEMLQYMEDRFHGMANKNYLKLATKHELYRGFRVQFPQNPRFIGYKPMQYVQVDVVDLEETLYGDHYYSQALIVTDLYSGFCFGRALSYGSDQSFIVRHLMDIFGTFAPPQGYRSWSVQSSEAMQDVMLDIEQLFKVNIKNLGFANCCTNPLIRGIYNRAEHHLGSKTRWVEALPFAVMDYNQKPNKNFEMALSPFEIMFGRRPWKTDDVPPWISKAEVENEIKIYEQKKNGDKENEEASGRKRRKKVIPTDIVIKKEFLPFSDVANQEKDTAVATNRDKIQLILRNPYPPYFDTTGKLVSPGTGYLFEPGDKVFVKNPIYDVRLRPKKPVANPISRYLRGCILYKDDKDVNYLYKVVYWDDDAKVVEAMDPHLWPAPGDGYDCAEGWFSPWDITASTPHIQQLRAVSVPKSGVFPQTPGAAPMNTEARCHCGNAECKAFYNIKCPNKLSAKCCSKLPKPCDYHSKPVAVCSAFTGPGRKDTFTRNLSLITFDRMRARGIQVIKTIPSSLKAKLVKREIESPERDARWGFKNGKLVALNGSSTRRQESNYSASSQFTRRPLLSGTKLKTPQSLNDRRQLQLRPSNPVKLREVKVEYDDFDNSPEQILDVVDNSTMESQDGKVSFECAKQPSTSSSVSRKPAMARRQTTPDDYLDVEEIDKPSPSTSIATASVTPSRKSTRIPKPKKFIDEEGVSLPISLLNSGGDSSERPQLPIKIEPAEKKSAEKGSQPRRTETKLNNSSTPPTRKRTIIAPRFSSPEKRSKPTVMRIPTLSELKRNMDSFRLREQQKKANEDTP